MELNETEADLTDPMEHLAEVIRRNRRSRREVARLAEGYRPISYEEWRRQEQAATPEELAETEEFLRRRDAEREVSLAAEAGVRLEEPSAPRQPAGPRVDP